MATAGFAARILRPRLVPWKRAERRRGRGRCRWWRATVGSCGEAVSYEQGTLLHVVRPGPFSEAERGPLSLKWRGGQN